ncbi:hypothetical protein C7C46_02450 [Streptomyces tateyamensis]|uniref:DoxX family membrane protein n=2 Tax=Streptomyces tateyamensis TaxID=565073 RepID=A0A2V4P0A2_9ACTN|nr:hypothetical protein C7C46_02450 [Streptomyces tateyamensis]
MELPGWDGSGDEYGYRSGGPGTGGGAGKPGGYGRGAAVPRQPHGTPGAPGGRGPAAGRPAAAPVRPLRPAWKPAGELPEHSAAPAGESSRHAWYPGRKVDLGLVLLPLRLVLGSLSVYAGFSKLCDPVYFDGGARGSMMRWLSSLHPWKVAQPLLDFAMAHPVGSGLAVAFTEVVVGVLALLGLWQRLAAAAAMLLSAALLFTVSWRAVPVYDTPDLIFLAAWSPLLIAGAPFASLDGRLALEAWRRYGPQAPRAVRRRVLRRGTVLATVVIGLTLLLGSLLGAAVRSSARPQPGTPPPTDYGTPVWPGNGVSSPPHPSATPAGPPPPPAPPSAPATPSAAPSHSARPHPSASTRGGAETGQGGAPTAPGQPGAGATPGGGSSGSGNRAPKPSPTGGGLIGGVLGSGPPLQLLPSPLGMAGPGGGAVRHPVV